MSKVFLSYSHHDQEFVEELYRKLKRDGVDTTWIKEAKRRYNEIIKKRVQTKPAKKVFKGAYKIFQ